MMIKKDLREWSKKGGCTAPHIELYKCATYLHEQLWILVPNKLEKAQEMFKEHGAPPVSYTLYRPDVQSLVQGVQIFSSLSIEAALNFYGVFRLGEKTFDKNYERLNIQSKLEVLLTTCDGIVLDNNDEIIKIVRRLVKARNALVHPKSEEASDNMKLSPTAIARSKARMLQSADNAIEDMKNFFVFFIKLVPESRVLFSIID